METLRKYNYTRQLRRELGSCRDLDQACRLCREIAGNSSAEQAKEWIVEAIESALKADDRDMVCLLLAYYDGDEDYPDYSALLRRCSNETLMQAIEIISSRARLTAQDLREAFDRLLLCNNFSQARWIYAYVTSHGHQPLKITKCGVNHRHLINNTEEAFSMLEWVKSINGGLPLTLLESAARTGSKELMGRMEAVCEAGDLRVIPNKNKANIAWWAASQCGNDEFAKWILERMGITVEQILRSEERSWNKIYIIGEKLRGEMLAKVIEYVATADEKEKAEFVGGAFASGNLEAVRALHGLIGFTTHYISIRTEGFEWMASSLAVINWTIETLGFNVDMIQVITTVCLNYGTEKAEEILRKLQTVEPNAVEFMRPLSVQVFSQVCQSQWESEPKTRVSIWLAELFNLTTANLEEDGADIIANSTNPMPPELMAWFLERFKPHWDQIWADRIYSVFLWKSADENNVETLELLNSTGIVAGNPQQLLAEVLGSAVRSDIDEFAVEWLLEKFRLAFELTEELILTAKYKTTRWFRWILRHASNIKVENRYLKLVARLNVADILAEHYGSLAENGDETYQILRAACQTGDVDAANRAVDEIIERYG